MCTSIYIKTKDEKHLMARTMDFSLDLKATPMFFPQKYKWRSEENIEIFKNKYGFIGSGSDISGNYFVADGINEKGLSVAELYFPGEATYNDKKMKNRINLAPHEFIIWLLGNFKSIDEISKNLEKVNLMDIKVPFLGTVPPLHWIITDCTGKSMVIEPKDSDKPLQLKINPIGVMTNSPKLEWHIENLRNYLNIQTVQFPSQKFGEFEANPFSQGTGTTGLPGGYTPPERFVRAAFFKENIREASNEEQGINNCLKILNSVKIPQDLVITQEKIPDYSQYISIMCNETKSFYFQNYETNEIMKLTLTEELLSNTEIVEYKVNKEITFTSLN